ncbi:MAG: substrate-binding domain-containing protein, partial [Acidobacteriota bacterium]
GHRKIAFFKGQEGNADTEDRWRGIQKRAAAHGVEVRDELTFQLAGDPGDEISRTEQAFRQGEEYGRRLLERRDEFTAVFAFNDLSAIGAIQALVGGGLRVPEDVSVVGFDDIVNAQYYNPGLTTVRQPLHEMGETAGRVLLERLADADVATPGVITIEPDLVVRQSTAPVR